MEEFKAALRQACSHANDLVAGRLVVLVDELDRCRPAHALDLIETVRHLFAVEGVVVVLAVNREELCHSIQSLYGADFDADRYLRRFADLACILPPPTSDQMAAFTTELLSGLGLDGRFFAGRTPDYSPSILQKITDGSRHNLRDLQQALHLAAVSLDSPKIAEGSPTDNWGSKQKAAALIVLRTLSPAAYRNLANGDSAFAAVAAMNRALTDDPATLADTSTWDTAHEKLEASLLAETLNALIAGPPGLRGEDSAQDAFHKRYAGAFAAAFDGTAAALQAAEFRAKGITYATGKRLTNQTSSTMRIDQLVGIIDLTAY